MRPRLSSKSFSRGHEELLSAFHRIVDLVLIAAGHYLACFFYRDYWRSPMTSATVIALVTFNLVAEWRGLYRPWRAEPLWSELKAAPMADAGCCNGRLNAGRGVQCPTHDHTFTHIHTACSA